MPSTTNASGRRKVRCPKCTALLTEPQTQIYECPICLTLLLAKGNPGSKLWENRVHKSDGDADDIQQTLEGGSKLEKATLINESSIKHVQPKFDIMEIESHVGTDIRSRASQGGHVLPGMDNQPLSGISFSKQKPEAANELVPKSNAFVPDTPPDTPRRRKLQHVGEISQRDGAGYRLSELDSASHSESEVDSSLWSSENANVGEVPDVPSMVSSLEASSLVDGSSEHLSSSGPRLSSGTVGNNGAQSLKEVSKFETKKALEARFLVRSVDEEIEHGDMHHPHEVAHEENCRLKERGHSESGVTNPDVQVRGKSVFEEGHKAKDKNDGEMVNRSNALAGSMGLKNPQSTPVDSTPIERASGDFKQPKDVESSKVGKFGLFDLSVFGIYNEDTYSELRRGKAAHYSKLSESGSDSEGVLTTVDGDLASHSQEVATESPSNDGISMVKNVSEVQKSMTVPESIIDGANIEVGSNGEVPSRDWKQDTDAGSSGSAGQEVDNLGNFIVGDVPNSSVDNDVLADARYGDHLAIRDLNLEIGSSVDISFGDWRLQQVVKPPQNHEQIYVDGGSVCERGMPDLAVGEDSDSSWDDEELTFSKTSNEESKLKETSGRGKEAQASHSSTSIGRSQVKISMENPTFPFRTTAMQKFLQRNEQEGTVQTHPQEPIEADSKLYEAPYMEHFTPSLEKQVHEAADLMTMATPISSVDGALHVKEEKPQIVVVPDKLEDTERKVMERQHGNPFSAHSMHILNAGNEALPPTPFSGKKEDAQIVVTEIGQFQKDLDTLSQKERDAKLAVVEDPQPRKEFDALISPQRDAGVNEAKRAGMEATELDLQNMESFEHGHANKVGNVPGKPASLRWKGKGRSSTQSLSSTEDDGAYGMESEAGSGPDRDSTSKQGVKLTDGHFLPDSEAHIGLGQLARGHYQPAQRTWLIGNDAERQKHRSGELVASRRTARSRGANARLSNQGSFDQADVGTISNMEKNLGRSGLGMSENVPAFQNQAVKLNRSMLDQGSNYSYNTTADYNSDHSLQSQDVLSGTLYNETFLSNPYGVPAAGSTQVYPFQLSSQAIPRAPSQQPGFTHSAHHCVSPTCSLCMQQQYYMQQPPKMIQNVMMHPCAACASQSSAAAYHQLMHHGTHSHHMHGLAYSNPSLRQHDTGSVPGHSQKQNRSNTYQGHLLPLARRPKLYPPLPGKDAPPFVLCKHCNQLLQVPGYFPPIVGPIQKLQCGSCEKISKFSVCLQAVVPPAERSLWATPGGYAMHASDSDNLLAGDKLRTGTSSIHSFDRIPSSGLAISAPYNSNGTARYTFRHGSQQEWVENRLFSQSSASGIPQAENLGLKHQATGGVQEQYRRYGWHGEGEHFQNSSGVYSEGYISSSPSSPSGSSPGRPHLISRQHQHVEPVRQRIPGFRERKLNPDSPALSTTMHDQGRPPFEAPSFSEGLFQKGPIDNRSRYSSTDLQGSVHDPYSDSLQNENFDRLQQASKAGSWHNQPADTDNPSRSALKSRMEHLQKLPAAPGSPLIEHFTQDADDFGPTLQQRPVLQNYGNGSRSTPWSPGSGSPLSPLVDSFTQDSLTDFSERSHERERPPLPVQDANKSSKSFAGLFKRSMKDRGGQGGNNRRKVVVNGHLIPEAAVQKAEELAGPIHSGSYWYDYQAGFWGVMGGPCLGILMPFIEEFHFPLAPDCAGGTTGILVNGRELHDKDLEVLAKRGMPTMSGKAYILDISGALFDDVTGQPLKGLGKLAPSIEKKGRGFGMSQFTPQP